MHVDACRPRQNKHTTGFSFEKDQSAWKTELSNNAPDISLGIYQSAMCEMLSLAEPLRNRQNFQITISALRQNVVQ